MSTTLEMMEINSYAQLIAYIYINIHDDYDDT